MDNMNNENLNNGDVTVEPVDTYTASDVTTDTAVVEDKPKTPGKAIASLILGIASVLLGCCGSVGIITGIISIILTCSLKKATGEKNTMATVGMILGIVGIVFSVIALIVNIAMGGVLFSTMMDEMSY